MALMFDKDKVNETHHPLVRLIRLIFYKRKITLSIFSTLYAQHGRILGIHSDMTNTNRNNMRKALNRVDSLTFVSFKHLINDILRLEIMEFSVTVKDHETGETITYGSNDKI